MDKTLREICDAFGVSRRAVQGYEKAGLISMSGKNERGYLLYDENMQKRIQRVKRFQQMEFSIKEIKGIIDAPDDVLKAALESQIVKLSGRKENIEMMISEMYALIEML